MMSVPLLQNPKTKIVSIVETGKTYYFREHEEKSLKSETARVAIFACDTLVSLFVVSALVVANWRGTWDLMDMYKDYFPTYTSLVFSSGMQVVCTLGRELIGDFLEDKTPILKRTFAVFFIYVYNILCNMQWRALWIIMDDFCGVIDVQKVAQEEGINWTRFLWFILGSIIVLAIFKCLRNISGPPFVITLDDHESTFRFPMRFRIQMVQRTSLYILDCLFSVLIVGTLVVFVWRGAWVLIDIYLFPEMADWSAWASLVLGYMSVAVAFLMQPAMRWLCDRINGAARLFAADVFLLFSLFGTLNVWRGIWNLLNIYFLPDNLELSCWITHWVSLILLILLGCSNSLLVRGVYIDAEEPAGKCVVFPCYYLRLIFQQAREKKNGSSSTVQLESMSKRKQEIDAKYADGNDVKQISINMESNHI